jgi:hypothetical protein
MNDIISIIVNFLNNNSFFIFLQTNKEIYNICMCSEIYNKLKKEYEEEKMYVKNILYCNLLYNTIHEKHRLIYNLQNNKSIDKKHDTKIIIRCSKTIKNIKKKMNSYWINILLNIIQINFEKIYQNHGNVIIYKEIEKDLNKIFKKIVIKYIDSFYFLFNNNYIFYV